MTQTVIHESGAMYEYAGTLRNGDVSVWREDGHGLQIFPKATVLITKD